MLQRLLMMLGFCLYLGSATAVQAADSPRPVPVADMGAPAGQVNSVATSPDGQWFLTEAVSGGVQIWSAKDGGLYRTFRLPGADALTRLVFPNQIGITSDAATIVALQGHELVMIDANTVTETRRFSLGPATAQIVANPRAMVVATADEQGTVSVVSLSNGHAVFHTTVPGRYLATGVADHMQLGFSPDGSLLTITTHETFELWRWATHQKLLSIDAFKSHSADLARPVPPRDESGSMAPSQMIGGRAVFTGRQADEPTAEQQHYFWLMGATFSPDGRSLGLCARDEITILSVPTGRKVSSSKSGADPVTGCFFLNSQYVLLPEAGQTDAELLAIDTGVISPVSGVGTVQDCLSIPKSERTIVLTSGVVNLMDRTSGDTKTMAMKFAAPSSLEFTPGNEQLLWATAQFGLPLTAWSLDTGEAFDVNIGHLTNPSFSGNTGIAADLDPLDARINISDLTKGRERAPLPMAFNDPQQAISLNEDGDVLALLSSKRQDVTLFSGVDYQSTNRIPADHPRAVAVAPDGKQIAVADGTGINLYSYADGVRKTAGVPLLPTSSERNLFGGFLRFSHDGSWLVTSENGAVRLIETKAFNAIKINEGNSTGTCAAFSRNNKRLAFIRGPYTSGVEVMDLADRHVIYHDSTATLGCPMALTTDGKILAASTPEGIELVSVNTGKTLASLYVDSHDGQVDWLVVTPDGLFDGTPTAWKQLKWRFDGNTFNTLPVESFFRDFYHPGLLGELVAGRIPSATTNIAVINRRQPNVSLKFDGESGAPVGRRNITLALTVKESSPDGRGIGSGVRDLRLFRNGTLVRAWRSDLNLDKQGTATFSATVPIVMGENHFTAYAFSRSDIKSPDAELTVTGDETLEHRGTAYIVSMGINHYAADIPSRPLNLQYAEADASAFAEEFRKAQTPLHGYQKIQVIPLMGVDATRENLVAVLQALSGVTTPDAPRSHEPLLSGIQAVQPEDGVFIFYAGHGVAQDGHFYFLPHNFDPGVPLGDPRSNTVSDADLSQMLEGISAERSFLVIDACNSGELVDGTVGPLNSTGLAQLAYEKGLYILAASKDSEPALEAQGIGGGHGLLTYALVEEGLKNGDAAIDGMVELRNWFLFASRRVPRLQTTQVVQRGITVNIEGQRPSDSAIQHPRLLYRREPESSPFVIARAAPRAEPQSR